jgi:hypothetical protein
MKSFVALAIATGISLGKLPGMPDSEPQTVLICSAEDGLSDTVRPRLDSMGADLKYIYAVRGGLDFGNGGLVILGQYYIEQVRPLLVIVDPLVAYIGAKLDLHRSNETRVIGTALAEIAEKHNCAILSIRHLTKDVKQRPLYRGLGSIDLLAACRSVLLAGHDPDNPQRRVLVHLKSNLAPLGKSIGYSLTDNVFAWTGESNLTAEIILGSGEYKDFRRIEAESRVLSAVQSLGGADVDMVAERLGIARITAQYHLQRMRESKQLDFKLVPVGKTKKILYSIPKDTISDSLQSLTLPSLISSIPKDTISIDNTEDTNNSNNVNDIKEKKNSIRDIDDSKVSDLIEKTNTEVETTPLKAEVAEDVPKELPVQAIKHLGDVTGEGLYPCVKGSGGCCLQSKYSKNFTCAYTPSKCPFWRKR